MKKRTHEALLASIAHWERIRDGEDTEYSSKECSLCCLFSRKDGNTNCIACPVYNVTNEIYCRCTPYCSFIRYVNETHTDASDIEFQQLAQAEVDFLKSLLPSESERNLA